MNKADTIAVMQYDMARAMDIVIAAATVPDTEASPDAWQAFASSVPFRDIEELTMLAVPDVRSKVGHVAVVAAPAAEVAVAPVVIEAPIAMPGLRLV